MSDLTLRGITDSPPYMNDAAGASDGSTPGRCRAARWARKRSCACSHDWRGQERRLVSQKARFDRDHLAIEDRHEPGVKAHLHLHPGATGEELPVDQLECGVDEAERAPGKTAPGRGRRRHGGAPHRRTSPAGGRPPRHGNQERNGSRLRRPLAPRLPGTSGLILLQSGSSRSHQRACGSQRLGARSAPWPSIQCLYSRTMGSSPA